MHHIEIENKLKEKNPTEDQINIVNEKMKANTILKNKFKKISSTYPYESEIESEYELMEIANNKVKA